MSLNKIAKVGFLAALIFLTSCSLFTKQTATPVIAPAVGSNALNELVGGFVNKSGLLLLGCGIFGFAWLNGSKSAGAGIVVCLFLIALCTVMAKHGELISWIGLIAGIVWFARSCLKTKGFFTFGFRKDKK